ncbi:MFS transporter [[Mycobacterium] holstebronense]|uniref:MFS transporter n=1 Tax=[Mycobacterium] holstebronense TaxID=3064288 RepID=A0ABN9NC72_9MYCO|nr:MFS transporter [Mycolicibacter sp. MU0102]CAJ1502104.1 MFS transporter [Mycolicibacter sp. MU0102]
MRAPSHGASRPALSAWRFVTVFGTVSLLADFVYEGARSITGPLLASFGATGLVVGTVTGIGEAAALGLRLVSGPLADRTQRFWAWTIAGYALTVLTVPLLGVAGTLWVACALVIAERIGKAVRSPAKDTLLSHATSVTGRGRGFAVHEALDQIGAVIGPLTVAGVLALSGGDYAPALGVLALPGAATLALLVWLRLRVPEPLDYERSEREEPGAVPARPGRGDVGRLPAVFWQYCGFIALTMTGFTTFGLVSFHLVKHGLLPAAAVPVLYAAAMGADAVAALASGWCYDRFGAKVLFALPILSAAVVVSAFAGSVAAAVAGALLWGAAVGIQESTLRAVVADLVAPRRRASAYGAFAAGLGAAAAAGGVLTGWLYDVSVSALIAAVLGIQLLALAVAGASKVCSEGNLRRSSR